MQAYLNETLEHQFCSACAVGNIVAESLETKPMRRRTVFLIDDIKKMKYLIGNFEYSMFENHRHSLWQRVFITKNGVQERSPYNYSGETKAQIDSTGYTWQELARIEEAFELAPKGDDAYSWMFNGLMAVVDVLANIHSIDLSVREEAKLLFVKV